MARSINGVLIRTTGGAPTLAAASKALHLASGAKIEIEPLFEVPTDGVGIGSTATRWWLARPKESLGGLPPWEAAHATLDVLGGDAGLAATGSVADIVEPDLLQQWVFEPSSTDLPGSDSPLAAAADACVFEDQDRDLPFRGGEFAWHLGDSFSQLRQARAKIGASSPTVRIAHLDTGYDETHATLPPIDQALQRNFIDDDRPMDARDLGVTGVFKNPGHGTGTLSILAGSAHSFKQLGYNFQEQLGGVPQALIVPVRVGNSVVQLTTSSVAKGIQYAADLCSRNETRVDVISMSMGGVASAAWADAVNHAYEMGIVYVAAAGNNVSAGIFGFPTHQIVYPARFRRVLAACGVMADGQPYYGLPLRTMQGNWGPQSKMMTALSAFTPNVAWARWGCKNVVRMSGAGTSSATPQIAAAAALYLIAHHKTLFDAQKYPQPWMRVEAVRQALFASADKSGDGGSNEKLGNGILRAAEALKRTPLPAASLKKAKVDSAGFPFLNVLSRTGVAANSIDRMLQLEATQLVQSWGRPNRSNPLEEAIADPDSEAGQVTPKEIERFLEVLRADGRASKPLRQRAQEVLDTMVTKPVGTGRKRVLPGVRTSIVFHPPTPPFRKLRGYAIDPSLGMTPDTAEISEVTFKIPWEKLAPGPIGEYLEVVDIDPASDCCYEPIDLDNPMLLAQDGLSPAEGVPQFHQQMVYAISSLTIANFERALGRKVLWRPQPVQDKPKDDSQYVQQLRIYPHALREANAFYSPNKVALLFGYFNAKTSDPREHLPGGRVFTCLSHDIVAHETTHAILDGMHRRFLLPTNPDVLAFHEAFADVVAMLQRFTFPELLAHQIATTRGDLRAQENLLGQLATQFGHATGRRGALRDIGKVDEATGQWRLRDADPDEYASTLEPHDRGQILVTAIFDALLSIYKRRTADLLRLATGGSGVVRPGAIHPDLVRRLASEAAKSAQHVLNMCIRAMDYCPPTDITFGEYLRAIISADVDLVADDDLNYRISFIDAFRRRGIYPPGVRTLSVGSLLWREPGDELVTASSALRGFFSQIRNSGDGHLYAQSRREIFDLQRKMRQDIHAWLALHFHSHVDGPLDAEFLGLDPSDSFEVHSARIAYRTHPDGGTTPQLLLSLLQTSTQPVDPADPLGSSMSFEGGCTIVADLRRQELRYCIRKPFRSESRVARQQQFALREFDSLRATYSGSRALAVGTPAIGNEPFALLHRGF